MVSLNIVSVTFPHLSHSMLTTMVMCPNFMLEKHFYYTISMFQLIRVFMCRESATSCDFYRRRQVDVFVLKTVEACAKFHERVSRPVCYLQSCQVELVEFLESFP